MTVENLDDHEPGERDSGGHLRCGGCGFRWPCPDVRAAGASFTPNEEAVLELVEPGWQVWARQTSPDVAPVGGLVLGFIDETEAGETRRVYRVLYWKNAEPHFRRLKAADLDPALCQLPSLPNLRTSWRTLARAVATSKGVADDDERRLLETAFTISRLAS